MYRDPDAPFSARARAAYLGGWARGWTVPDRLSVWEWADRHRILPRETSKESGPWRTDRNPVAKAIMESLSPHSGAEIITVVAGTQTVKTESMNNFVGYILDHDPGTIVVCQPTKELGNAWKLMRFDPLVDTTPALRAKISVSKRRDSSNTMDRVKFPGGWVIVAHAAAATSLGMVSARYVLADEVDSYEELKGAEGDPLLTLRRRADSFGRTRKIYQCSSPKKLMGASLIWREYLAGNQSECYVPCPHCAGFQVLRMENVLPTGEYLCEHCGRAIPHSAKPDMLAAHDWRAKHPERTAHHSYRLPSLYSPLGLGSTWLELHEERDAALADSALMKAFVSTRLAIPYEPPGALESDDLRACIEPWPMRQPPADCLLLVAATDVQANRLETTVMGFGAGPSPKTPQIFLIDYHITPGSPIEPQTWADLDAYLEEPIVNPYGLILSIRLHAVDSGNWSQEVYVACHERAVKGWLAVKGSSALNAPLIGAPKLHDLNWRGRTLPHGGVHHMIGTIDAKDALLDRLAQLPVQPLADRWWHLPHDLPDAWFAGITSERRDPETGRWEKIRAAARNEPLDTAVYCWAVAHLTASRHLGARRVAFQTWSAKHWNDLRALMCPLQSDLFAAPEPPAARHDPARIPPAPAPDAPTDRPSPPARPLPRLPVPPPTAIPRQIRRGFQVL